MFNLNLTKKMVTYRIYLDLTMSVGVDIEVDEKNEEKARALALAKVKKNPYYYASHALAFVDAEVDESIYEGPEQ